MSEEDSKKVEDALRRSGALGKLEAMTKSAIVRQLKADAGRDELARTPELDAVLASSHGRLALAMAIDLFEHCGLNFTTSVMADELGRDCKMPRAQIMKEVGDAKKVPAEPVLLFILAASAEADGEGDGDVSPPAVVVPAAAAAPPIATVPKTATKIGSGSPPKGSGEKDDGAYSSFSDDD